MVFKRLFRTVWFFQALKRLIWPRSSYQSLQLIQQTTGGTGRAFDRFIWPRKARQSVQSLNQSSLPCRGFKRFLSPQWARLLVKLLIRPWKPGISFETKCRAFPKNPNQQSYRPTDQSSHLETKPTGQLRDIRSSNYQPNNPSTNPPLMKRSAKIPTNQPEIMVY